MAKNELHPAVLDRILADIQEWRAGRWAAEYGYGPACHCGLRSTKEVCRRHGRSQKEDRDGAD